jgi:hypothetical protein
LEKRRKAMARLKKSKKPKFERPMANTLRRIYIYRGLSSKQLIDEILFRKKSEEKHV